MGMDARKDNAARVKAAMAELDSADWWTPVSVSALQNEPGKMPEMTDAIVRFILANATYVRRDRLFPSDPANCNPLNIAHGALGVAYALKRLTGEVQGEVAQWILQQEVLPSTYPPGLYLGLSGIAWALDELGYTDEGLLALRKAQTHPLLLKAADVFHGATGFGLANLHFWQRTRAQAFLDAAAWVGDWLLESKQETEQGYHWPTAEGAVRVGYAFGASGVALFLLYLYVSTGDKRFLNAGLRAVDFDLHCGISTEGFISFPEDVRNSTVLFPYWLNGTAGVATALVRYVAVTGSNELQSRLGQIIPDIMRKYTMTPGLFEGLAGLGNVLLDCYQFLGEERYLEEAHRVADGVLLFRLDKPSGVAFPGDYLYRISADFATGSAGIGLFLHRLLHGGGNFNFVPDSLLGGFCSQKGGV